MHRTKLSGVITFSLRVSHIIYLSTWLRCNKNIVCSLKKNVFPLLYIACVSRSYVVTYVSFVRYRFVIS